MAITTWTKTFGNAVKSILPVTCGIPTSVLSGISDRYVIEITADQGGKFVGFGEGAHMFTINAYLQEKITLTAGSDWAGIAQGIPGYKALEEGADFLTSAFFHKSAITSVSTNRKWAGSRPIGITLKLKFEAVNNVEKEVLLPCQLLQGLTLPSNALEDKSGVGLTPPGPSGFTISQESNGAHRTGADTSRGEQISINIGNFLGFRSVIVREVKVTYENRMSNKGPIGAEVDLTIESWRMMTRKELAAVYDNDLHLSKTEFGGYVAPKEPPIIG